MNKTTEKSKTADRYFWDFLLKINFKSITNAWTNTKKAYKSGLSQPCTDPMRPSYSRFIVLRRRFKSYRLIYNLQEWDREEERKRGSVVSRPQIVLQKLERSRDGLWDIIMWTICYDLLKLRHFILQETEKYCRLSCSTIQKKSFDINMISNKW